MKRSRLGSLAGVAVLTLVAGGCRGGGRGGGAAEGLRPSDGLLSDPELQGVVELGARRDGAALVGLLSSPGARVRARAAFALGSVQDPGAAEALAATLRDAEAAVRADAAFALGQIGDPSSVAPLAEAFAAETDASVRRAIIDALGRIASPDAPGALLALQLSTGEELHRLHALARLGATKGQATQEGQDHLLAYLDHADPALRAAAAYYFGRFPDPAPWAAWAEQVRETLAGYSPSDPAAMYLVQALGRLGDPFDGERLRSWAAEAGDWRIRANAVSAVGSLPPDPANREALLGALDDPAPLVAVAAAQALARWSAPPSELQRMKDWVGAHPDLWQVSAPLLELLARSDEREFVLGWVDALGPADGHRWSAGLHALSFVPGQDAMERLRRAAASPDPRVQGAAVNTLRQRWAQDRVFTGYAETYFAVFAEVLKGGSPRAARSAAQALADPLFADMEPTRALVEAYRAMSAPVDQEVMTAILESLGRIGSPEAQEVLSDAALHPNPELRRTAGAALAALGLPVPEEAGAAAVGAPVQHRTVDWVWLASLGRAPRLRLQTERGMVVIRLLPEEAPYTVHAVAGLARDGAYDGTPFHRVAPNFVVQGGDIAGGDGSGIAGFTVPSEFTRLAFGEGVVGMASSGKDTENSQFFIVHSPQPHLDGAYTAFGWVEKGMDVVYRLMVGDRIVKATVERGG